MKKLIGIIIILIVIFSAISVSGYIYFEQLYSKLHNDYDDLEESYDSLYSDYYYLETQYNDLSDEYDTLSQTMLQYSRLSIDSLMMLTYNKIREECQPEYNPWWGTYYYDSVSVEYAANACAHDLDIIYWPSIEDNYYDIRGTYLSSDAYDVILNVLDIIDISYYDNDVDKVEKILDFIYANIEYVEDINDEFLFPVETLTFKSGDCDDFAILAAALFEEVGIESAIGFFTNESKDYDHCMVLVKLSDLGEYGYWYYDDLTNYDLSKGQWIIIEPQATISEQGEDYLIEEWELIATAEIPNP